jgi:hypothetical protein
MTRRKQKATVRHLPDSDPRNPDHPANREQYLEVARALGRVAADRDFDRVQRKGKTDDGKSEDGSGLC